ncbi:hypothetical protein RN333_09515 [Enterobacter kobei]|jgi:hypothetical protein|uniref:hypothetical protein n=1 Tax=Enterobacter kobei TaxID=208224 RepID=UPI001012A67F|nr:hypothetical protein [Enterobacter kobei]WNP36403.1 hypothetical protein RN333_09515 [Enterobacter kobei]
MYKTEEEKLCDQMIGEAVADLLNYKKSITLESLLLKLHSFLRGEHMAVREAAILCAIDVVENALSQRSHALIDDAFAYQAITTTKSSRLH